MIIDRKTSQISHHRFYEIENFLGSNDVLVLNKTKVFPARLFGKKETGGKVEILLHKNIDNFTWEALTKPGLKIGQVVTFKGFSFKVAERDGELSIVKFDITKDKLIERLQKVGITPVPPYIHSSQPEKDLRRQYQTVYARDLGSVAAPTAGFHFTERLLKKLKKKGVQIEYVTLHVGMGTFAPVKTKTLEEHKMHEEEFFVDKKTFERLNQAKKSGKRIVSIGTTSTRVLETISPKRLSGSTNIFIYPPYKFKFVDALITNFHLPSSTLLALISSFVSYPNTKEIFKSFHSSLMGKAYLEAMKNKYRFYSFGDACFII
jgi:S-adenosylmethionine:tRNA ribosyltransferase-isomerase